MVTEAPISLATVQALLEQVVDPEIPVMTIADMGILRGVSVTTDANGNDCFEISITPTYSGCPAMDLLATQIRLCMLENGIRHFTIRQVLSPAWTTDWMSDAAKEKLRRFGIAPPVGSLAKKYSTAVVVPCPHCGSMQTEMISAFSSTACKALYTCKHCLEPFDYFKCH